MSKQRNHSENSKTDSTMRRREAFFADQFVIRREPRDLLGRFFLDAETQLENLGVTLKLEPLEILAGIFDTHTGSHNGLAPMYDYRVSSIDASETACLVGRNAHGEPVVTVAARKFDLTGTTLRRECENLQLWYGTNAAIYRPTTTCRITAPIADTMTGPVVCRGAYWVHPRYRSQGFVHIVPEVIRYFAISQWDTRFEFLVGSKVLLRPDVRDLYRCEDAQTMFTFVQDGVTQMEGPLLWSTTGFLLQQLHRTMAHRDAIRSAEVAADGQNVLVAGSRLRRH